MQTQSETQLFPDLKIAQLSDGNDTTGSTGLLLVNYASWDLVLFLQRTLIQLLFAYKVFLNSQASFK